MTDMSVALGQDMKSSAIQLGKALNDPVKGVTALQRVGVSFTQGQRDQIEALVKSGKTLEAQNLILAELNKEFGGSAKAAGETLPGQLAKARNAFEGMAGNLMQSLLPALTGFADIVSKASGFLAEHESLAKILVVALGGLAAGVWAVSAATKVWSAAQAILNLALAANPIGAVILGLVALGAAITIAWQKSETFRDVVTGAWDAIKGAVEPIVKFFSEDVPAAFQAVLDWLSANWKTIATIISGPFAPIVALATDAFGIRSAIEKAFRAVKTFVGDRVDDVVGFFTALPGRLAATLGALASAFVEPLKTAFREAKQFVSDRLDDVVAFFEKLPGRIAGFAKSLGTTFVDKLGEGLATLGRKLLELVRKPINAIIGAWNALGIPSFEVHIPLPGPVPDINFSTPSIGLPDIPALAEGGIAHRPTLALIGEEGPEAVVPLGRGVAGTTVIVNNYIAGSVTAERDLAEIVRRELYRVMQRNGTLGFR